ncbi:hypothetical protein JAAARDRAFT_41925 [Jaapia argillacea MUCL 33604]|uniref:dihydroneopterin aldolase n=1 Tax=Jaapia argillacea MUCL 33604 TaxID=933084 RepID=A0A067P9W4_9AGAM|nr:hypothetical protein JAAARDRAFT_41925 [Jaapia argillacea MUCL 33604]
MSLSNTTDKVFVDSLQLSTTIGLDWWQRPRPQPISISVFLHLTPGFLDIAGKMDDVAESIHYGHLSTAIKQLIAGNPDTQFDSPVALAKVAMEEAFKQGGHGVEEVRIVMEAPKLILLADGLFVDMTARRDDRGHPEVKVLIKDLLLAVIIGVNPPEREAKQRVVVNIEVLEQSRPHPVVDYSALIAKVVQRLEPSSYLTLEKFVFQAVRVACLSSEGILAVTVRAQKPSAIAFARSSGVEITRPRSSFIDEMEEDESVSETVGSA